MTAIQIEKAAKQNETVGQTVPTVGECQSMSDQEIQDVLDKVHGASLIDFKDENGTRVHIHYEAFGKPSSKAIQYAQRAAVLGLPRDRYTGRVHRIWKSKSGETCITVWVELERDHMYRTLNLNRGKVFRFVVMGD